MIKKNFPIEYQGEKYWFSRSVACAVVVLARDKKGHLYVLTNKRGQGSDFYKGYWNIPGGFIDFNENAETCAARECFEETGVVIDPKKLKLISFDSEPLGEQQVIHARYAVLHDDFIEDIITTNEHSEPDEVEEIKWMDVTTSEDVDFITNNYQWTRDQIKYIKMALALNLTNKLDFTIYSAQYDAYDAIPSKVTHVLNGVYLTGSLQTNVENDITYIERDVAEQFQNIKEGIYTVDINDSFKNVIYRDCILYFWHCTDKNALHWYRGLICLPDDETANKDALEKFNKRAQML